MKHLLATFLLSGAIFVSNMYQFTYGLPDAIICFFIAMSVSTSIYLIKSDI